MTVRLIDDDDFTVAVVLEFDTAFVLADSPWVSKLFGSEMFLL